MRSLSMPRLYRIPRPTIPGAFGMLRRVVIFGRQAEQKRLLGKHDLMRPELQPALRVHDFLCVAFQLLKRRELTQR